MTSAGESSSPQGVLRPNESFIHFLYSATLLLATSAPRSSNTQWRGKPDAPTIAAACVPSALIVNSSVVHTIGAKYWMNGGCLTARGIGAPVRPPTVCVNVTDVPDTSGSACRSGSWTAGTVIEPTPSPTVVAPMTPPPQYPDPVIESGLVDVDVRPQLIREPEPVTHAQFLDRSRNIRTERVGWGRIVMRHLHPSRDLAHALEQVGWDP